MRKFVVFIVFVLVFSSLVLARDQMTEKRAVERGTTVAPAPASQGDVQKLQEEIQRLRREALAAEKNSVARSEAERLERQRALETNKAALAAAEGNLADKLEAMKKDSIAREAQRASEDQLRFKRIVWSFAGIGAILMVGGTVGAIIFFFPNKKNQGKKIARTNEKQEPKKSEILFDPGIPALKEFSQRNNDITKIPFILSLNNGQQFNCLAELREDLDPLVYIGEGKSAVAWDKRRQTAAKFAVPLKSQSNVA